LVGKLKKAKDIYYLDSSAQEYRLVYMSMGVAHYGLFGPHLSLMSGNSRNLAISFTFKCVNTVIDAVNINNILNHKKYSPIFGLT
jgi:hypothetical protein